MTPPLRALALAALAGLGLLAGARSASAQEVRSAVLGDTIRVGDIVPVAVRVVVDRTTRVAWPDTLPLATDALENAARVRERVDTLEDGRLAVTGVYAVTPWRTGELALPDLPVQVVDQGEGARAITASLPPLDVVSVLPADTAGIEPRPARGVLGASWAWWPFVLALIALLALVAALVWWLRRRRRAGPAVPAEPPVSPRDRALARIDAAREAGLVERGELKEFYSRVADAIRDYLAALAPTWGEDLTTTELLARFRGQVGPAEAHALADILRPADQVKFARRRPDPSTALAEWETARSWVAGLEWPPRPAGHEEAA